ncbi:MAG: adenylosuccinate lyase, partial [Lachnospiraceae bacterium]|nr:adenylosuccinate lyase [Lachnospiraceae bacterium]
NLLELIAESDAFDLTLDELKAYMVPENYTGRAAEQVEAYLRDFIKPMLEKNKEVLGISATINV